jgi:hypothetical protein
VDSGFGKSRPDRRTYKYRKEDGNFDDDESAFSAKQGPILQNSVSAETFSDKFSVSNFRPISTQKFI